MITAIICTAAHAIDPDKVFSEATIVTASGNKWYVEKIEDRTAFVFNGEPRREQKKMAVNTQSGLRATTTLGVGIGIYINELNDRFALAYPLNKFDIEYNSVTSDTMWLISNGSVTEDGKSWDVYYVCTAHQDTSQCKEGGIAGSRIWKITKGDVYKLARP